MRIFSLWLGLIVLMMVTWDCQSSHPDFSILNHSTYSGDWELHKKKIKELTARHSPDIVTFQNISKQHLFNIEVELSEFLRIGELCHYNGKYDTFSPIFIKKGSFNLIEKSQFIIYDKYGQHGSDSLSTCPGLVSWVKLKNNQSGYIFYLFNASISNKFDRSSLRIMYTHLQKNIIRIAGQAPIIVTGNLEPDIYEACTIADSNPFLSSRKKVISPIVYNNNVEPEKLPTRSSDQVFINKHVSASEHITYHTVEKTSETCSATNTFAKLSISIQ